MAGNIVCPACGTGTCTHRDGIMCRAWVCASGVFKGGSSVPPNGDFMNNPGMADLFGSIFGKDATNEAVRNMFGGLGK